MAKSLPTLCFPEACTACSACANICPASAITMVENAYGEHHPSVDPDKCLGCKLCEKTCPEANPDLTTKNAAPTVYSCWLRNADDRKQSTSGGAAFAISSAVIRQGGHVWGAAFDANLQCRYTEANTIQQLRPIQKSKYVQSFVGDAFQKIKAELDNGDLVLFCGTGCHVKGLLAFLRRPYDNLLTLDLVCHGVPGQGSFRKYVSWLETKYSDRVINYVPRYKRPDGQELRFCRMASFERKRRRASRPPRRLFLYCLRPRPDATRQLLRMCRQWRAPLLRFHGSRFLGHRQDKTLPPKPTTPPRHLHARAQLPKGS